jgi:hypothetical protein
MTNNYIIDIQKIYVVGKWWEITAWVDVGK